MLQILAGKAQSIRLEIPGEEGRGVEFRLVEMDEVSYYQVKRQRSAGPWSIRALRREGVLAAFFPKLSSGARCVFASTISVNELPELIYRTSGSLSWDEFSAEFLSTKQISRNFQEVCDAWPQVEPAEAYELLKLLEIRTMDEDSLNTMNEERAGALFHGDPSTVVATLAQYAADSIHQELAGEDLFAYLEDRGLRARPIAESLGLELYWRGDELELKALDARLGWQLARASAPFLLEEEGKVREAPTDISFPHALLVYIRDAAIALRDQIKEESDRRVAGVMSLLVVNPGLHPLPQVLIEIHLPHTMEAYPLAKEVHVFRLADGLTRIQFAPIDVMRAGYQYELADVLLASQAQCGELIHVQWMGTSGRVPGIADGEFAIETEINFSSSTSLVLWAVLPILAFGVFLIWVYAGGSA